MRTLLGAGIHLAMCSRMSSVVRKCQQVLSKRFGVRPEFATALAPLFERCAQQRPSSDEWERILAAVAAAYRSRREVLEPRVGEIQSLLSQFTSELRKLDETLKVLSAYLERVRERMPQPTSRRVIH